MDEEQQPVDEPEAAPRAKGGLVKKLVMGLVLLTMTGGGAAWWLSGGGEPVEAQEPPLASRGLVTFEPFLVNLADAGGNRFLKVTVQLVIGSPEEAAHVAETPVVLMQVRSAILELLTEQTAPVLVTADGKQHLKEAIKTRVSGYLEDQEVIDVLFSEFVVQF